MSAGLAEHLQAWLTWQHPGSRVEVVARDGQLVVRADPDVRCPAHFFQAPIVRVVGQDDEAPA